MTANSASKISRIACPVNLQKISDMLAYCWTFSIALDTSTIQETGYLNVRCRISLKQHIHNLHLLAIPLRDRHTGEVMFNASSILMNSLCNGWEKMILSVSTDGDRSMTGRAKGLGTRIEQVAGSGFTRVWCGLHQLDLVMQAAFKGLLDECFYEELTTIFSYLRRQQILIAAMGCKCPKVADTRWLSAGKVVSWFRKNQEVVTTYIRQNRPTLIPSPAWWTVVFALDEILLEVTAVVTRSQGMTVLVPGQESELRCLRTFICELAYVEGPLTPSAVAQRDSTISSRGRFSVSHSNVKEFLEDLGSKVMSLFGRVPSNEVTNLLSSLGEFMACVCDGITNILDVAERSAVERASPPVLFHQLAAIRGREFAEIVQRHKERLLHSYPVEYIDQLETEHRTFCKVA
jgi:hypothetical protein